MNNTINELKLWGCDINGAMQRFINDEELYLSCLSIFLTDESFKTLEKALQKKDYQLAFDSAHTLKGVSANLGLTPLLEAIVDIVEPLRLKDYSNLDVLYQNIVKSLEELKKYVSVI